jgi:lipid II:glycine glycyltransferase (peptidoglycan interpeptide bridge formation enzyme)
MATVLLRGRGSLRSAFVPRGPVPATAEAVADLAGWARERRLARLRVEPEAPPELAAELHRSGFQAVEPTNPKHTWIVPLGPEEEMLAGLEKKHRWSVRAAERRGVMVEVGTDVGELERLAAASARRQKIRLPRAEYYRTLMKHLPGCRIYFARHPDHQRPLAAAMVVYCDSRAYYLYSGWTGEGGELNPNYALQWRAMCDAAEAGLSDYDLWGVPPAPERSHPWYGLWHFKTGFGGKLVEYAGAWELVLSPGWSKIGAALDSARRTAGRLHRIS